MPLNKAGQLVAVMCVTNAHPRSWTDADVTLLQDAAERDVGGGGARRAEASLRASEERFRGFAENTADTLWIMDAPTTRLEYLSPAFERMWEVARRRPRHWPLGSCCIRTTGSAPGPPAAAFAASGVAEYRIVRPSDGAVRWIRDTGFPIRDETRGIRRIAGIAQDVTNHKQAETEREAFVSSAAHDLRTPLTTVIGQLQLPQR